MFSLVAMGPAVRRSAAAAGRGVRSFMQKPVARALSSKQPAYMQQPLQPTGQPRLFDMYMRNLDMLEAQLKITKNKIETAPTQKERHGWQSLYNTISKQLNDMARNAYFSSQY